MPVGKSINSDFGSNNNKYIKMTFVNLQTCEKKKCSNCERVKYLKNWNFFFQQKSS